METNETPLPKRGSTIIKIPVLFGDDTFRVANSVLKKRGGVAKLACHLGKRPDRIGRVKYLKKVKGRGVFSELGEEVYDDYWMYYLTKDMAKALEIPRPYTNLKTYLEYKQRGIDVLSKHKDEIIRLSNEEDAQKEEENGEEE